MNAPPTIVHAAADLRREALLAEAASDRHTTPRRASARASRVRRFFSGMVAWSAAVVSRIVDEFEPIPGSSPPDADQIEPLARS